MDIRSRGNEKPCGFRILYNMKGCILKPVVFHIDVRPALFNENFRHDRFPIENSLVENSLAVPVLDVHIRSILNKETDNLDIIQELFLIRFWKVRDSRHRIKRD